LYRDCSETFPEGLSLQAQPKPFPELVPFEPGDFHALSGDLGRDPQYNDRRLIARRKLAAIAKQAIAQAGSGFDLEDRTSLHNPHAFNRMWVRRLWAYLCRGKASKARLKSTIGPELAKDLDAAYRNAYLCVALESEAVEVSLRIHPEAWYDGQNLVKRIRAKSGEGMDRFLSLLNGLPGFRLSLDNWKGEWPCGNLTRDRLEEYLRYYVPGELGLAVERRWKAPPEDRSAVCSAELPAELVGHLQMLLPLYRFAAWSRESDFLFT
jgi:hypothetical protein